MALTRVKGKVLQTSVDTINDLPTTGYEGQVIEVLGYWTKGDGGGGTFRYDSAAIKNTHNGGTIFDPDIAAGVYTSASGSAGVWVRQYDGAINVKWFGTVEGDITVIDATGTHAKDSYDAITAAFNYAVANSVDVVFTAGIYNIYKYVNLKGTDGTTVSARGVNVYGKGEVIIHNTQSDIIAPASGNYFNDGFRIGDASATDGGTGTSINIQDVTVDGFRFSNCRMGVWVVYGRDIRVKNISANKSAVVGIGNDNDDECENILVEGCSREASFEAGWYTVGLFSVTRFKVVRNTSAFAVSGQAIVINACADGYVCDNHIDQVTKTHSGIVLYNSVRVICSNNIIKNAGSGILTFGTSEQLQITHSTISNNILVENAYGLDLQAGFCTVQGNTTRSSTSGSLKFLANGIFNIIKDNNFTEGTLEDTAAVANLQTWYNNVGLYEGMWQAGNSGDLQFSAGTVSTHGLKIGSNGCITTTNNALFDARETTNTANITGDGTWHAIDNWVTTAIQQGFNATTGVFTAPVPGYYQVNGSVYLHDGGSGYGEAMLQVFWNSGTKTLDQQSTTTPVFLNGSCIVAMGAGETLQLRVYAAGGTKTAYIIAGNYTNFSVVLVG